MWMQLTFKSGAQVEVDVDSFETSKNPIDGSLVKLTWETPNDWTAKLHRVDLQEVVAIVALRRNADASGDGADAGVQEGAS